MSHSNSGKDTRLEQFLKLSGLYDDGELRQLILRQAIQYCKSCSTALAKSMRKVISEIHVNGFRKGKAPESKVIGEICRAELWKNQKIDVGLIFELWMEANQKRIAQIVDFLNNIDPTKHRNFEGSLLRGDLPPDYSKLVDSFRLEHFCEPNENIEMLFYATMLLKEKTDSDNTDSSLECLHEKNDGGKLPSFWEKTLQELRGFSADAEEWAYIEEFVRMANEIHEAKDRDRLSLFEPLTKALKRLQKDGRGGLDYLDKNEVVEGWDPLSCDPRTAAQEAEQVDQLRRDLKKLVVPLPSVFSNFAEEEAVIEKRKMLKLNILRRFENLEKTIGSLRIESEAPVIKIKSSAEALAEEHVAPRQSSNRTFKLEKPAAEKKEKEGFEKIDEEPVEEAPEQQVEDKPPVGSSIIEELQKIESPVEAEEPSELAEHFPRPKKAQVEILTEAYPLPEPKPWTASMTCKELASVIRGFKPAEKNLGLCDLLWAEIRDERLGLAYWFARHLESLQEEPLHFVPSWLVEFIAIGRHLKHSFGPLAPRLSKLAENFSESIFIGSEDWKNGMRFLMAGAMIRPAVIAPASGSSALLSSIRMKGDIENTYQLCHAVIEFGNYGHSLSPLVLGTVFDRTLWHDQLNSLIKEASDWLKQAPKMSLIFQPATKVWIEWQKPDSIISRMVRPICENNMSQKETVREMLARYSDESNLKAFIDETDRSIRRVRKVSNSITGRGLTQILSHAFEAFEFVRRWLALSDKNLDKESDWLTSQIDKLRNAFSQYSDGALAELAALKQEKAESFCITGGISVLESSIAQSRDIFESQTSIESGQEISTGLLLNHDLLLIPSVKLKENWTPVDDSPENIVPELIEIQAEGERTWKEVFKRYSEEGDHEKTAQILDYLRTTSSESDLDELEEERTKSVKQHKASLSDEIDLTIKALGEAVAQDLLTEEEYTGFSAEIDLIDPENVSCFPEMVFRLKEVRKSLEKNRKKRLDKIKSKLKNTGFKDNEKVAIEKLIDADDIGTAEEFMVLLESGESFPDIKSDGKNLFQHFFPSFINQFEDYMKIPKKPRFIIDSIKKGQTIGPVSLNNVRGAQLQESVNPIKSWLMAKQARNIDTQGVRTIFSWMGFDVENVEEIERSEDRQWFRVFTKILRGCPIPDYGSSAHGDYRLLCVYGRPPEELVVDQVAQKRRGGATVVFYFGRMSERQLRNLSWSSRENPPGALQVDESGIFFLLGERGSRVNTLFRIALPFMSNNPYKPFATGNVPPEMFYGRSKEKESILDPHGSCFIYGGRQLGKSALMRAVEREFHQPSSEHFAFYVDLNAEGLGESRPVDDIWKILYTNLHHYRIAHSSFDKRQGSSGLIQGLLDWAQTDQRRRLLILLDEADLLLDEDARVGFVRITAMKKVMDNSERRIKFVFAGLHNVQRFTRIPNQPLAHLGAPVCIGPMLNNGEWKEARKLIETPFNALGYQFEPRHLVNRILAHTNYQPSLIQLFCETLVHHLSDPNRVNFDQKVSPPYVISEKHVDSAYLNTNLRKNIKDRFELTLNLDPRYQVIAYVIAHAAIEDEESHRKGFSIPWITREVNYWWPKGFAESSSIEDLRGFLDEMIGLGVLTRNEENRYRLRSPNVLRLLGSQNDIEHTLLSSASWELPRKYHSSVFRRGKEAGGLFRSPVTGSQESDLLYRENGIRLVFGSEALGLNNLKKYLDMAKPDSPSGSSRILPHTVNTSNDFLVELGEILSAKEEGLNLIFIQQQTPFSKGWVEKASKKVSSIRSQSAICRIFFMFDPNTLFSWLKIPMEQRPEYVLKNVQVSLLKRWTESTLERWLSELSLPPNSASQREQIMEKTGGWPSLIFRFAEYCINKHLSWNESLEKMTAKMVEGNGKLQFLSSIGLSENTIQHQFIKSWAELGEPVTAEDLGSLFEQFSGDDIETLLSYAETLGICRQIEDEKWQVEKLTGQLLM